MDTSWWPAVLAVVVLALVAAVVDGLARSGRRPKRGGRGPARRPGRGGGRGTAPESRRPGDRPVRTRPGGGRRGVPEPGEIWWAMVPFEDSAGKKDRPCLVLAVRGGSARVAKITSRHHAERPGVIPLPPGTVGDARGRPSFLETDELRDVALADFRRRAGTADPRLWDRVRHLAG
ncbi:transcriptional modulator of MazE/toxin, MazF [Streptomyces sp. Ru73]|uniref:type II toxin-antitoxin system PemK/MazF family toxin n=1 Tax=Streptomyces sp. Ru73 TaxID=2080748 RepID=UPI000CDE4B72|nr:type II toxin-antitoxin system PemK/MazF family toxin [Streptomyces sp. Ru73]POX40811.1 transcriptional modulator of MazE/toxin, MazF [Streptomyces sp. Ru73]